MHLVDGTHVNEPADYRDKKASMFDAELEAVPLVEESATFNVYLYL